jgi:hypothetical protein
MTLHEQLIFDEVIEEADGYNRAAQEELHRKVEEWFEALTAQQKSALGRWLDSRAQYEALVALSSAAGDWNRRRLEDLQQFNDRGRA